MGFGAADCDGLGVEVLGVVLLGDFGKGGTGPRGDTTGALAFSRDVATSALVETGLLLTVAATQVPARGL